jgi:hypothetical protein
MARALAARVCLSMLLALSALGCSDDADTVSAASDAATASDASSTPASDAGTDGSSKPSELDAARADVGASGEVLKACLDAPTDLPTPPSGELPCALLPPGFQR